MPGSTRITDEVRILSTDLRLPASAQLYPSTIVAMWQPAELLAGSNAGVSHRNAQGLSLAGCLGRAGSGRADLKFVTGGAGPGRDF